MQAITEVLRLPSPAPRPQALAFDGETLWMGSIETNCVYEIDPVRWTVRAQTQAPGPIWGLTVTGDELRAIVGENDDDIRSILPLIPGHGFRLSHRLACPENTGSQLSYDGDRLYLSQWYNKRILSIDAQGIVGTTIPTPRGICGQVFVDGVFFVLNTDDENTDEYYLTRIDARSSTVQTTDLAKIPFAARALAYDGRRFWTNHREQHEIVAFTVSEPGKSELSLARRTFS